MIISWTYYTVAMLVTLLFLTVLFCFWTTLWLRRVMLVVGMAGLAFVLMEPAFSIRKKKEKKAVSDIMDFLSAEEAFQTDTVELLNLNFARDELSLLDSFVVVLSDTVVPTKGIYNIVYPKRVIAGNSFTIKGKADQGFQRLYLERVDGSLEELTLQEDGSFLHVEEAKVSGLFSYVLKLIENRDTIHEVLPIQVTEAQSMRMLVLASRPSFDLNYLKNYWTANGHSWAQRIRVSKDKFNTSFVNTSNFNLKTITRDLLSDFDILYLDFDQWNTLSYAERDNILNESKERGLGVLLRPGLESIDPPKQLPFVSASGLEKERLGVVELNKVKTNQNSSWKSNANGVVYQPGFGNIMVCKYVDSYLLLLNDEVNEYDVLWSEVFGEIYQKASPLMQVDLQAFPVVGEKVDLYISGVHQGEEVYYSKYPLKLLSIPWLENVARTSIIPVSGWNKIERSAEEVAWFHVFEKDDWRSLRERINYEEIQLMNYKMSRDLETHYIQYQKYPWWLGYVIMLLGFSSLWFHEKWKRVG